MIPYITVRIARIEEFNRATGRCTISYSDGSGSEPTSQAILPQPLAVGESGIFVEPTKGAQVLVDLGLMNQPYIISYLPDLLFEQQVTLNNSTSLRSGFLTRPIGQPGEVTIKGFGNTYTRYTENGDIETRFGTSKAIFDSDNIYSLSAEAEFVSLQSGYQVSGIVRRELSGPAGDLLDKLTDPQLEFALSDIARNSFLNSALKSSPDPKASTAKRNPPFVEQRSVVYEFARDFSAGSPAYEKQLYENSKTDLYELSTQRQGARTDALGLGPLQHNVLFESIFGTTVDTYGNVLDINRVPLNIGSVKDNDVDELYQLLRRTIKLHLELNSRKPDKPDVSRGKLDSTEAVNKGSYPGSIPVISDHSRWSIDVDAEGQTKINIPASSRYGNIPVAARYVAKSYYEIDNEDDRTAYNVRINPDDGGKTTDIVLLNYNTTRNGPSKGVVIEGAPESRNESFFWNMPYHDFTFNDILSKSQFFYPGALRGEPLSLKREASYSQRLSGLDTQTTSSAEILSATLLSNSQNANAGGRSLHMNLDGSAELSFGADQADGKSLLVDTAGSSLIRLGKDLKGRSLVVGADGDVALIVGASRRADENDDVSGGSLQIFVQNKGGDVSSIQIIDGNIVIKGAPNKNVIIESAGNLVMNAGKDLFLGGERIFLYGKYDEDGAKLGGEREVVRSGNKVV